MQLGSKKFQVNLVLLATAWGPKFGGINSFNVEFARSLNLPDRAYELICIVPSATAEEIEDAQRHGVRLMQLANGILGADLSPNDAEEIYELIAEFDRKTIWIGHDTKTGPVAIELRRAALGDKTIVIHHMAFGAYQDFKRRDSSSAEVKRRAQQQMFARADFCFAVGPMLKDQLNDLLATLPAPPPVHMLIPGLAEPDPEHVSLRTDAPRNFTVFLGGRLGGEDEPIKQPMLGVKGFARAIQISSERKLARSSISRSPSLRMRGIPVEQHSEVREVFSESCGGKIINFDLQEYTQDRNAYFSDLAGSSVALMPSWHEGFGLVAWEAIACRVPVVLGEQSGVFRLLDENLLGMGLNRSVHAIDVQGRISESDENVHSDEDVSALGDAIALIGSGVDKYKSDAVQLERQLRYTCNYTWAHCAAEAVDILQGSLGFALTGSRVAEESSIGMVPPPQAADIPEFLAVPSIESIESLSSSPPSTLLLARSRVVRFDPAREPVIENWLKMLQNVDLPEITFQLMVGPGGSGKTRSALELIARASKREYGGWAGLWLPSELPSGARDEWEALLSRSSDRLLLIVDYAEGKQNTLLDWLCVAATIAMQEFNQWRLHVICLARTSEWWGSLAENEACPKIAADLVKSASNLGVSILPPLSSDISLRGASFNLALKDYASALKKPLPVVPWQPRLEGAPYDRPLYIHLAALAALAGESPAHANALLESQLRREFIYWSTKLYGTPTRPETYALWAFSNAWLGLVQGASRTVFVQAMAEIQGLQNLRTPSISNDERLSPIQPDLLGEALVVQELGSDRGIALISSVLRQEDEIVNRAFESLSRLGKHPKAHVSALPAWGATIVNALTEVWTSQAKNLVTAAHALGTGLVHWITLAWRQLDEETQCAISTSLEMPRYSTPLLQLAVDIGRARLKAAKSPFETAVALDRLSFRIRQARGPVSEALELSRRAVEIAHSLEDSVKSAHWDVLANATSGFAICLAASGGDASKAQAISLERDNLAIVRKLSENEDEHFQMNIVAALDNLSKLLSKKADHNSSKEAIALSRESIQICRPLSQRYPEEYLVYLPSLLTNLAERLSKNRSPADATEAVLLAKEAVNIRRTLVEKQPSAHLAWLASALCTLANRLRDQGGPESLTHAISAAEEAVQIRRELLLSDRHAIAVPLAAALSTLADKYFRRGDAESLVLATSLVREAVGLRRDTLDSSDEGARRGLIASLERLSKYLSHGQSSPNRESVELAREARSMRRALAESGGA